MNSIDIEINVAMLRLQRTVHMITKQILDVKDCPCGFCKARGK